ncbi:formate dehydrogenase subunit alpha [Inmirania thermothiophila]|uniref:NADH-quinone oxidoreductase subunit G n=1 Tax=Inmirania thermothiophila TaxID=1750597 RepID=A0A3N1YA04_9GAMM|nr:formate dehydrogenase subunit alpha [Inmirania thermothiophila]ROR34227.1 NAD-dependent formate dehydrogenase catalytic subunit /NAD-dependent formate dehydrogenase iron-sulfur protein [Inmirania thermothiophila]
MQTLRFRLDGRELDAREGETILEAARRHGIAIPHLCWRPDLGVAGNCRTCLVEVEGEGRLAAACHRRVEPGMVVRARGGRAARVRRGVLELLLAEAGGALLRRDSELERWAEAEGARRDRFRPDPWPAADLSHPAIAVERGACIRCTRCVRACRTVQGHDVLGMAGRGAASRIAFDLDDPMGASLCVGCGECVQACPTGALAPAGGAALRQAKALTDSVCPYCGVGCQVRIHVHAGRVLRTEGLDGPSNRRRLCVKGRFGLDYVHHPERLTRPLVRLPDAPKDPDRLDGARTWFREADWDEALARAAGGLAALRARHGGGALAGFGSAKGSNEEAYLFQKLVRLGFGSHNVDHCTRLCHASSVAALLEGIGSGAVSNQIEEVLESEVLFLIGANPAANHPVAATFLRNAARAGATLIVADPRRTPLARDARLVLQFRPGSDVALLDALLHVIIHEEDLVDHDFVRARVDGFEALAAAVAPCTPERMAALCDVPADTLRAVARTYARARRAMILWGMGVSQHTHGTDNVRALIALALVTGQIGRRGTGLHPLRGQNNVQGASDAGLIPMMLPGYAPVADAEARVRFERLWGARLAAEPGLTVVEILDAAARGEIRGMYIVGENPAMSDPNLAHAREGLARLDHLVVQDLFLTETAALADVVLPASAHLEKLGSYTNTDRRVQLGRPALPLPGEARQDLWIITEMGRRLGLPWTHRGAAEVYDEMRAAIPALAGIPWRRLEREGAVTYPCPREDHPGHGVLFADGFPLPGGRARLVPATHRGPAEPPDRAYPWTLLTGRLLEHWHTGAMTRRAAVLDALEPEPVAFLHPEDLAALGLAPGAAVTVATRRGRVTARARPDPGLRRGEIFMPFCYREAAANLLTLDALDPWGRIPEFKCCAAALAPAGRAHGETGT